MEGCPLPTSYLPTHLLWRLCLEVKEAWRGWDEVCGRLSLLSDYTPEETFLSFFYYFGEAAVHNVSPTEATVTSNVGASPAATLGRVIHLTTIGVRGALSIASRGWMCDWNLKVGIEVKRKKMVWWSDSVAASFSYFFSPWLPLLLLPSTVLLYCQQ